MIINIFLFLIIIIGLVFYIRLYGKHKKTVQDISKIYKACKRLRYGDIHTRIADMHNKTAEAAVNRLFETISDRELMVKEYQSVLSQKNLLLEKNIKQEKEIKQAKEDFTAALAHDMKVPVIAELNSIEYLLNGRFGSLNDKQLEILKLMKSSNKELKELIENMLEVYRLEQKGIKLNLQKVNLNKFIVETAAKTAPAADSHKIICEIENTKGIELEIDSFQAERALKNLIQNAVIYGQKNSEIIIETKRLREYIDICVKNKGAGIIKEDLEFIFNKYSCGHSKFRRTGTGLGLYIAKQIMEAHGGNISADISKAEETGYTSFILSFKN